MNEHWKEIAEELGSYDVDEYGTRFPARRRKLIVVDGTFYDPGEHVDTEIACKRIADLEAEVEPQGRGAGGSTRWSRTGKRTQASG
jgi:hypothetical protein